MTNINTSPVGSGCVAQVYSAELHETAHARLPSTIRQETEPCNRRVAIKVIHPFVATAIQRDLALLSFGAWVLEFIPGAKWLSLSDSVAEFRKIMEYQLDLRKEVDQYCFFSP